MIAFQCASKGTTSSFNAPDGAPTDIGHKKAPLIDAFMIHVHLG